MKVLIAEDTESVRCALRLALEFLGHQVVGQATDGVEALKQCEQAKPEIVLMDVRMPRMDGLTCTTLLSQLIPRARVIIVTGGRTTEQQARAAGALGFVEKPFDLGHLNRTIQSLAAV